MTRPLSGNILFSSSIAFLASEGDAYLLLNDGPPSTGSRAFLGESVVAMRTPARPPNVAKRTKRGRGFGGFRLEAADDVDDDDDEFVRVAVRMPERGILVAIPGDNLEL